MRSLKPVLMMLAIGLLSLTVSSNIYAQGKDEKKKDDKHDHPSEGPHKGCLAEWGEEEYHVEVTFDEKKKQAVIYILDDKAKNAKPIAAKEVILTIKGKTPVTVKLAANPEKNDPKDTSSRFSGTHDVFGKHGDHEGTVSGKVGNKPYSGDFKSKHSHNH